MRDKEFNRYHRQEFNVSAPEDTRPSPEIYDEGSSEEFLQQNDMFASYGEYNEKEYVATPQQEIAKSSGYRHKIIRKMAYMVTAAASVVVISQTVDLPTWNPPDHSYSEEEKEAMREEFQDWWESIRETDPVRETDPTRPVPPVTQEHVEPPTADIPVYAESVGVDVSQYDGRGYTAGGVMPVRQNGLWGLIDYNGQVLLAPTYPEFVSSPNDHGYTVFGDGNRGYIYDARGRMVYQSPEETDYLMIGENDIIMQCQTTLEEECRYVYLHLDGSVIFDTGWQPLSWDPFTSAVPFHEGRAYVCAPDGSESSVLYEVTASGAREIARDGYGSSDPEIGVSQGGSPWVSLVPRPIGAYSQGYFVENYPAEFGYGFYHPDSRTYFGNSYGLTADTLHEYGIDLDMSYMNFEPNSYKANGAYLYNYGPYGVITIYDGQLEQNVKDFLVDMTQMSGDCYSSIIAAYDGINIDDFHYLSAMEDGRCFYIDFSGNVVSGDYDAATMFTDSGYALVLEETTAYVINDRFEKLKTIEGVGTVGYCGDCFTIHYLDGSVSMFYYVEE